MMAHVLCPFDDRGIMVVPGEDRRWLGELNELAAGYCADGRHAAALPLFEQVVVGCTARLGADDPDTLISHGNLVVTQLRLDPSGPALQGLDANLAARQRVLGAGHPATRVARAARSAAFRRAVEAVEAALAAAAAEVGPRHPDAEALRAELDRLRTAAAADPVPESRLPEQRRPRRARFRRRG